VYPGGKTETNSCPTGKHCTNYRAEVEAIMQAITLIEESQEDCSHVVVLTDALSVLEALNNCRLPELSRAVSHVSHGRELALQWIPAHCGVPGNEQADSLAKLGAKRDQPQNTVRHEEKVTLIKALMKPKTAQDDYHLLTRAEQVALVRLRTGHNRLNAHMHDKLKLSKSPLCSCALENQTAEHLLQRCPHLEQLRRKVWPASTPLEEKLYGNLEALQKTAHFIAVAGVTL
jgi:ribonuclease HI